MKNRSRRPRGAQQRNSSKSNVNPTVRLWVKPVNAALIASVLSIALIVLYSLILYMGWLDISTVHVVNTVFKIIGSVFAAYLAVRRMTEHYALMGGISGAIYILFAFLIFSILSEKFEFTNQLLLDIGMGILAGILTGMLCASIKKKTR